MVAVCAFDRGSYLLGWGLLAAQVVAFLWFAFGGVAYPQVGALLLPTLIVNTLALLGMHESRRKKC